MQPAMSPDCSLRHWLCYFRCADSCGSRRRGTASRALFRPLHWSDSPDWRDTDILPPRARWKQGIQARYAATSVRENRPEMTATILVQAGRAACFNTNFHHIECYLTRKSRLALFQFENHAKDKGSDPQQPAQSDGQGFQRG